MNNFSNRLDEYRQLIWELASVCDVRKLAEALDLLPGIIRGIVRDETADIRAGLHTLSGTVRDISRT